MCSGAEELVSLWGESVCLLDMQSMDFSRTLFSQLSTGATVTSSYEVFLRRLLLNVHPDDKEDLLAARKPQVLIAAMREKRQVPVCEYRYRRRNSDYRRMQSRVYFSYDAAQAQAVFVIRDIENISGQDDAAGFPLLSDESCTEIYEIDLDLNCPTMLFSSSEVLIRVDKEGCNTIEDVAAQLVHPDDRALFLSRLHCTSVRLAYAAGATEVAAEYRRLGTDGTWHWVSSVLVPARDAHGVSSGRAMLFNRDVTQKKQEEQQRAIREQYDHALRNIYDEVYELNITKNSYTILYHVKDKYVTPPASGVLIETVTSVAQGMIHPLDRKRFLEFLDLDRLRVLFAQSDEFCIGEFRKLRVDGWFHWASLTIFPVKTKQGRDEIFLVFIMDIDARKRSEEIEQQNILLERQRIADERYKIIVEQTNTLVFEWADDLDTSYVSPELSRRFDGVYDGRSVMRVWQEDQVVHGEDMAIFKKFLEESESSCHVEMTVRLRRREGQYIWCKVALSCLRGARGGEPRFIGTLNDVDDAVRSELALRYRAEYDTLTGIHNMQTFYVRAAQLIRSRPERQYYIIRMDIDRFKVINDLFGMAEGDRLLKTIASTLSTGMNAASVCARMSGDVFCACVDFSRAGILEFVNMLADCMATYPLTSRVVPSFGICRVDNVDTPISALCDWANLALKTVKGQVLRYYAFYDETLRERILEERRIESSMHGALMHGEFCLYLQPKVDIQSSYIVGAEALVRWNHPTEGIIAPDSFIPLFEKNGFIIRLDEFIWEETCKLLRRWIDSGYEPLPISVNVSRMHIHDIRFCEKLPRLLAKYDLPPRLLELELTESVFLDNADQLVDAINELRKHGFIFSLDDFGAGYSSLNMLKSLPIEIIKIDRGFLTEVVATDRGKVVIRHIIALAKALDMQVVAEGVENQDQASFLMEVDCALAQGYHYSRPVTVPQFEELAYLGPHALYLPGTGTTEISCV